MKIIKHGNHFHKINCPTCNAHIAFLSKEVTKIEWAREGTITCPECDERIVVSFYKVESKEWVRNQGIEWLIN